MRICSFLPGATEIVFALGLDNELVGVTHECDYPPEAQNKPVVVNTVIDAQAATSKQIDQMVREHLRTKTTLYAIDLARLRDARPDIVLTQALCEVCALDYNHVVAVCQLLGSPPKIIALNPNCLSDVFEDIRLVGNATARTAEAEALVSCLRQRVATIQTTTSSSLLRPRVVCLEWLDPLFSAGHWVPEMVELAGGTVGLAQRGEVSAPLRWQQVVELSPDVLILMPCGFGVDRARKEAQVLFDLPGWSKLPAVQAGRVFAVNGHAYFNRSGPRLIDGLEALARMIHPEMFPWDVAPETAQRLI